MSHAINHRYVNPSDSDEFSIGLIAFNEAIDSYNAHRSDNFLEFAQLVITRKVINYRMRNRKFYSTIPFSSLEDENGEIFHDFSDFISNGKDDKNIKDELLDFKNILSEFNITIWELVDVSPKHKDAIDNCVKVAHMLHENKALYLKFLKTKLLPISYLVNQSGLSRKTIERNRKYIIATVLILDSNLDILKEFLRNS